MSDEEERMSTSGEESEQEDDEVEEGEEMEGGDEEEEEEEPAPVPKGPKLPPGAVGFGMMIPSPGSVALRKVERPAEKAQPAPTDVKETEFGRLELKKTPGPASNKPAPAASGEAQPEFAKVKLRKTNTDVSQEITVSSETTATHNNNNNAYNPPQLCPLQAPTTSAFATFK
jgi:hypothetical protein